MKNRIASLFLVFALLMSLCTFAVARDNPIAVQSGGAERFTDVPASHWAYDYIDKVVGSGLFNGKTPTTFEPSNAMTRSQFVMVMARMEGMSSLEGQYTTTKFPDVTPTRRAAGPIAWASSDELGYVRGFGDGTFKPDSPITRGQFAALIHRYIVSKRYVNLLPVDPEPAQFTDADSVSSAFTADVEYARIHGLLTGYSDGTVRASNPITRAAIAAILARFLDLVVESGYIPLMDGPVDNGDSGDSGNSQETPPVETPTEYPDIKLLEKNGTHGDTSIVSVTRNGQQVAANDLKEGDLVTVRHDPDSGYVVSIRVKDSKNKTVKPVTTKGNISTFKLPKNLPVTITVTYTKESSGGGGGGGSSSGGGGYYTNYYYLKVAANVLPVEGGTVFLTQNVPGAVPANAQTTANSSFISTSQSVAGYAVFVPNAGYEFESATSPTLTFTANDYKQVTLTKANSTETVNATYVSVSGTGTTSTETASTVSVTGNFKETGGEPGPGPGPTEQTWTINAQGDGAYFQLLKEAPTGTDAVTADTQVLSLPFGTVSTTSGGVSTTSGGESVYLAISPRKDFAFGDTTTKPTTSENPAQPDGNNSAVTLVSPTTPTATDTLRVYEITKTSFANGANTTTVSMNLSMKDNVESTDYTYDVTVKTFLGTQELSETDTSLPVRAFADKAKATMKIAANPASDGVVTVTAPVNDTNGVGDGYKVTSVTVKKVTDIDRVNLSTPETVTYTTTTGNTANEYTFDMPGGNVEVVVTYETVQDEELTYTLNVTINGSGSAALNVAGTTENVSGTDTTIPITVNGPKTKGEYAALYPNRTDFKLPVYLTGTPVAGKGYKYEDKLQGAEVLPSGSVVGEKYFVLEPGTTRTVTITFDELVSYGYNLTVIGNGTVTGNFNNEPFSHEGNANNTPQTYSSGLIVDASSVLTLNTPQYDTSVYEAEKPVVDGVEANYGSISLTKNALTEIVVEIHKKDREAYPFTVKVENGGSVLVKPESGKIGNSYDANAKQLGSPVSSDPVFSGGPKTYYAFEDTVITLVPQTTNTTKVKSITINPNSTDIMATAGYSFQLKEQTTATVTFGTLEAYSVTVKAPYNDSPVISSESTGIAPSVTLQNVLYSLNDGARQQASKNTTTNITNEMRTAPVQFNRIVDYYLNHDVATSKNSDAKITGSEALEEVVADAIQANISTMVPSVVEAKKADIQKDDSMVKEPLETAMKDKQASYDNASAETANGAVKSSIVKAILDNNADLKAQFDAETIKESDFDVKVKVTPIISAEKETAFTGLDITGKSVQKQLERFVSDYLSKIRIDPNYDYNALTPEITVAASKTSTGAPVITLSAKVNTTSGWPTLDNSLKMSDYLDQLNVYVVVAIDSITLKGESITPLPAPTLESSSQFTSADTMKNAVKTELDKVDANVATTWNTEFAKLLDNNNKLSIDMGQVLTKELLDQVVDEMLKAPMETVTGDKETGKKAKIESVGDGAITKSAFMNLYRDFVVVNSDDTGKFQTLTLKTNGAESTYPTIGEIDNNTKNLVLTIDFEKILRDGYYNTGTPANPDQVPYEQLVDLVIALRDGISEDIRTNAKNGETSQTVIATIIENQMKSRGGLTVTKWGTAKSNFTDVERKEIANLFAELVMNSETEETMQTVWQKLENNGYSSVQFSAILDASKRAKFAGFIEAFYGEQGKTTLDVGFKVEQTVN
ncbi:MAG: S-layer homology domain-containing protein [Oscillospiraceae bacterium]|nr:S-layer homology domain-containing protein [Oscillospiraceae bacterium]